MAQRSQPATVAEIIRLEILLSQMKAAGLSVNKTLPVDRKIQKLQNTL